MRIGIDARFYGPREKGLGRYVQKLIENLEKIDTVNEFFVFLRSDNFKEYQPRNKNFHKVLADCRWYTFSEQIKMPFLLKKHKLDLVHFPHFNAPFFYREKFVVTIHDLILVHFPTIRGTTLNPLFYWIKFLAYKTVIRSAIKRARRVITVSNFTKKDIIRHYPLAARKIIVTPEAADETPAACPAEEDLILRKYGIIKPYLLYVGNAYPHKNLETLVLAFSGMSAGFRDLHLALVGKEDYFYRRLKNFAEREKVNRIIFTGFIADKDLEAIYKNAELFVFPSLYEGFGLPPLEAMRRGIPVVSSNHECMREVLGEAAYYFDAKSPKDMARAMKKVLQNEHLRLRMIKAGRARAKKYNWEKTARATLETYKSCSD